MNQLRLLLIPFSFIYGGIMAIRNALFSLGVFNVFKIPGKSIVIGNLSTGGTGKSPHVLYLLSLLSPAKQKIVLSRGYGRTTKGYLEVTSNSNALQVGDEPLMFKKRLGDTATVIVSESRKLGIETLDPNFNESIIVLDDAFQHRKVEAGFSILLTDYAHPFYADFVLPAGNLREFRCGKKRADCVVVTKCPTGLNDSEKKKISKKINLSNKPVFFSSLRYDKLVVFGKKLGEIDHVLLVTGIANPKPLEQWLKNFYVVESVQFTDHHNYTREEVLGIHQKIDTFAYENTAIVTTEKDFVRLDTLLTHEEKEKYPWYYQPITVKIDEEEKFKFLINSYVDTI